MALNARISKNSDAIIQDLVSKTGKTKIEIIDEALECYRFQQRMLTLNKQFEKLRANENLWQQELDERRELEGTYMDGLDNE